MGFETPQLNTVPEPEPKKKDEKSGILESLQKKATKALQLGALLGTLASAEVAEGQSTSRGTTHGTPEKPKAEKVVTTTSSGTRTSENASRSVSVRAPSYSARGTVTSHGERTTGIGTGRARGRVNLPKTGFEKKVEAYHGGKMPPSYSQGYRPGTVSKRVSIDFNIRKDTRFNSGLTRPKPRRR